jgi:hypothetical protein
MLLPLSPLSFSYIKRPSSNPPPPWSYPSLPHPWIAVQALYPVVEFVPTICFATLQFTSGTCPNRWRHANMPERDKRVPAVRQLTTTWWLVGLIKGVTQPQLILEGMNARQVGVGWGGVERREGNDAQFYLICFDLSWFSWEDPSRGAQASTPIVTKEDI